MDVLPISPRFADDELSGLGALELGRRMAARQISSVELTRHFLERIERHDVLLGAFIDTFATRAIEDAKLADAEIAAGRIRGPLHGVPTAMKDHHMVRGTRMRLGSRAFDWLWTPMDDPVVRRVKDAGMVIVGKTSMSELGLLPMVEPARGRPTRNAWSLGRTAGGSSGGAGAALGAGLLPVAPGSDGAGSVRIPSSLNGLFGLKPSRGLVRDGNERIDIFGLTTIGPMGRSVDDIAALLDVLAHDRSSFLSQSRAPVPGLRLGIIVDPPFGELDPRIVARIEAVAGMLEQAGHGLERVSRPEGSLDEFTPIYQRLIAQIPLVPARKLEPTTRWFVEEGRRVGRSEAQRLLGDMARRAYTIMDGVDVVISPTVGVVPPRVGQFSGLSPEQVFRESAILGAFTAVANITGQPALTLPVGRVDGVPVGMQLIGRHGHDAQLLALARHITQMLGDAPDV